MFGRRTPATRRQGTSEGRTMSPMRSPMDMMRSPMDMLDMFDEMWRRPLAGWEEFEREFVPAIEVSEKDNEIEVRAELPGLGPEDVDIRVDNNNLILSGEKKEETKDEQESYVHRECTYGRFYRSIPLRGEVDPDKIKAKYKNGVLTITAPVEDTTKSKKIEIES